MPSPIIQWFPGHMAKTRRLMSECLPQVDIVIELLDARIPVSSRNPEIQKLVSGKPLLTLLTKSSLSDPAVNRQWEDYFAKHHEKALFIDSITGFGLDKMLTAIRALLQEKTERYEEKGMAGRSLKAMVVGIPNAGKSSLINKLCGAKKAKVEDRPGVTLNKQWVKTTIGLELLDMPGVLWPKFEDQTVGEHLAMTGAIKDQIIDIETLAVKLTGLLRRLYPALLNARYKINEADISDDMQDYELFELIGKKRGFLLPGGMINEERTAVMLLDEFRSAKIGKISLEAPNANLFS
ncbi:MAG: ribosome biogenesis GTPase YlqF [Clostridiales bacterium]|nr:ribosome biogenesis GTPase YlqF [Clostridiales bacterium]